MALPNMVVVGNLKEVLGDVVSSELVESALSRARIIFTSNVPNDAFVKWSGSLYRVMPVQAIVNSDGDIVLDDGEESPVRLLAQDDGLDIRGLQWQVRIDIPSNVLPIAPSGRMRSFWFGAVGDGEIVNLKTVAPTLQAPLTGTEVSVPAAIDDLGGVSPFGKTLVGSSAASVARSLLQVRRARTAPDSNGTDDTIAVQALFAEGGEIVFPKGGTWIVDTNPSGGGILPQSNTRIIIEEGAIVKAKSNALDVYRLFDIGRDEAIHNVIVEGAGTILGDLSTHTGTTGEYGHLIHVTNGSSNIQILGPLLIKQAWGDGIYIGDGSTSINYDVLVDGVIFEDCRREAVAPFWVDGCTIRNTRILNTGLTAVTAPGSGIDCEPNAGQLVNYLTLENNYIEGTAGCGIYASANPGPVTNLIIRDNEIVNCGLSEETITTYQVNGIHVSGLTRPVLINNIVRGSGYDGDPNGTSGNIYLRGCSRPVVKGGYLAEGLGNGIQATTCVAPEISNVTIYNNFNHGIFVGASDGTILQDNQVLDNVQSNLSTMEHIAVQASNNGLITGNILRGSKGPSWIRIETSGNDNLVANNIGLGPAPTAMLVDNGTRTRQHGNKHIDTNVYEPWTTSDMAGDPAVVTHAATAKTTPVDADEFPILDSAASFVTKKSTWANIKATLLAWFGGLPTSTVIALHNQADQTTNYERARHYWNTNVYSIEVDSGGTGTLRTAQLRSHGTLRVYGTAQAPTVGTVQLTDNTSGGGTAIAGVNGTLNAASGVQYALSVSPTFNQSSTAGYTALLVNPTETATGSGTKKLIDAQVGSTSKFSVDNTGKVFISGTAAFVSAGTGTPEAAVTAPVGSLFLRTDGGASTTLYVKQSGTGNTGWVAK